MWLLRHLHMLHKRGPLQQNDFHGLFELVERDDPVVVLVDFVHDFVPDLLATLIGAIPTTKHLSQLVLADLTVPINVE